MYPKHAMGPMMQPMHPAYPYPAPPGTHAAHGFCPSCRHPVALCCCQRTCRKIEKELLAQSKLPTGTGGIVPPATGVEADIVSSASAEHAKEKVLALMDLIPPMEAPAAVGEEKAAAEAKLSMQGFTALRQAVAANKVATGVKYTVIGGGCCVHLSIEYMPLIPVVPLIAFAGAMILDSKATMMIWGKWFSDGYHVKEGIISTHPGAHLLVVSVNAVARVRWCEIISC